jgi:hypothetical protein
MPSPSWKWLSSRPTARELATPSNAPTRPCLPMMEQLGDRIMLSASPGALASENPPPTFDQILIGMVKGEVKLATSELSAIKFAGAGDAALLHKFTEGLIKVDDVLIKVGEDLIKGDLTEHKENKALEQLKIEFLKLDALVGGFPDESQERIKFVLDTIKLGASDLLTTLTTVNPTGDLSHKEQELFLKITDSFSDFDTGLLKLQEDLLAGKKTQGDEMYLKIKLSDILVSGLKVDDETIKGELQGLAAELDKILIGLLKPTDTDGGGGGDVIG